MYRSTHMTDTYKLALRKDIENSDSRPKQYGAPLQSPYYR